MATVEEIREAQRRGAAGKAAGMASSPFDGWMWFSPGHGRPTSLPTQKEARKFQRKYEKEAELAATLAAMFKALASASSEAEQEEILGRHHSIFYPPEKRRRAIW